MTIEQRFQQLTEYVNGQMLIDIELNNDFYIRDVYPYQSKIDDHYHLIMKCPNIGSDKNHGYGKLKKFDKEIGNIQIRYYFKGTGMEFKLGLNN